LRTPPFTAPRYLRALAIRYSASASIGPPPVGEAASQAVAA